MKKPPGTTLNVYLPVKLKDDLEKQAARDDVTLSKFVRRLIERALKGKK